MSIREVKPVVGGVVAGPRPAAPPTKKVGIKSRIDGHAGDPPKASKSLKTGIDTAPKSAAGTSGTIKVRLDKSERMLGIMTDRSVQVKNKAKGNYLGVQDINGKYFES